MSVLLLKVLHAVGLTNLTDAQVERYAARAAGRPKARLTFTSELIVRGRGAKPADESAVVTSGG